MKTTFTTATSSWLSLNSLQVKSSHSNIINDSIAMSMSTKSNKSKRPHNLKERYGPPLLTNATSDVVREEQRALILLQWLGALAKPSVRLFLFNSDAIAYRGYHCHIYAFLGPCKLQDQSRPQIQETCPNIDALTIYQALY